MKRTPEQYRNYKKIDFFYDEYFISSVREGNYHLNIFWIQVGEQFPETKPYMEEAAAWIMLLISQPVYQSNGRETSWQKIQSQMPRIERRRNIVKIFKTYTKRAGQAAAVIILSLSLYDLSQQGQKMRSARFGQKNHFVLPDESEIDLNSNSSLRYVRNWKSDKPREVWLKGEALFHVKHVAIKNRIRESDYFRVHAGGVVLTVTGTRFNVKDRRGVLEVALLEGSLRVEDESTHQVIASLKPGQSFTYTGAAKMQISEGNDSQEITAWKDNEIRLNNSSVAAVIADIEDNFGYKVVLRDSSLLNRHLSGTIPARNLEDILFVLRQTLHVETQITGNQITIK